MGPTARDRNGYPRRVSAVHWFEEGGTGMVAVALLGALAWGLALSALLRANDAGPLLAASALLAAILTLTTAYGAWVAALAQVHAACSFEGGTAGRATMIARGEEEAAHLLVLGAMAGAPPALVAGGALALSVRARRRTRSHREP